MLDEVSLVTNEDSAGLWSPTLYKQDKLIREDSVAGLMSLDLHLRPCLVIEDGQFRLHVSHY